MTKKKPAPKHLHLSVAEDEKMKVEILTIDDNGNIVLKGKAISLAEFIRFLKTYEDKQTAMNKTIAIIAGVIGGIATTFLIHYLQTQ